jgi:DNA ligase (NAD+)
MRDQIELLGLKINDQVYVEKGGEIIPKIVGVDESQRDETAQDIIYIDKCPECGTELIREEGEAKHYCPNEFGCPPQIKGKIQHFISRKAMDIDGLGEETIDLLYKENLIKDIADLYTLKKEQLLPLERMGEKSADNIIKGIEASKNVPFEKVLYALGIRFVGETVAKKLATAFETIDKLASSAYEKLVDIEEIGGRIAESVIKFFQSEISTELLKKLKEAGLKFEMEDDGSEKSDKLGGKTFVISGVFEKYSRDELKELITNNGGKNTGSISKKTDFLLAGDKMGPAKLEKAQKLGLKIISEEEFLEMIK